MSEEQIRSYIIDKDSYDKNILVEAGAGAGKTRLIIQRVIGQIGAGIPVEKIVLITFTNAAANELYERIQAGLTENIAKCSGEEKKLYENAVMNLQRMKISTIHSFCLSMLSEQPFEADLHLGLKLAEDGETKQAQADFFERYYRTNGANMEDFGFLNSNQYKLRDSRVKNFLMETFLECAEYRDVEFVRDKSYDSVTFDTINKLAYKEMCNYRDSLVRAFYNGALSGKYEDIAGFLVDDVTKKLPDDMKTYDPKYNYVKVCANLKACKKFLEPFNKTKIKKDHPKSNENMAIFSPSGFDNVKKEFIQENGVSNGDTTKRSDIFKDYQLSVNKDKRLSGTWTLEQYEGQYRSAMYAAVKAANPNWKPGQKFDTSILDNVTRESVEATLVKNGNRLVRNSIDVSV